jgi:thiol:disulfide interchange protein DsbD
MSIAFGILGLAASFGGASISVAFEIPAVQVAIAVLFVFFAIGMLGIVELQPPAWLVNLQGGAQKKAGSLLGAFLLGVVAAVLASPCTGPVIAGMFVLAAKLGSAPLGFLMFFTLGLGMAAVLFAFGALNFAAKPGPWMVWVRYAFAVILSGVALYYLANAEILSPALLFVAGFLLAALFWVGVSWHLRRKEGAPAGEANVRGAKVAVLVVLATAVVAFLTKPPPDLGWTKLRDVAHLEQEIERSVARGRPVVVDIWATWCKNCKKFEHLIAEDEELKARFRHLTLLKIDVTNDPRDDLRWALGMVAGQPQMVFVDRTGLARRSAYIASWKGTEESRKMLRHSLAVVLDEADASAPP